MATKKKVSAEATDIATPSMDISSPNEVEDTKADLKEDIAEGEQEDYSELVKQVESEFKLGIDHMRPKWNKWITRLKLYNNQKRDDAAVGDPLLFTTFQTVFASLYDDKLQQEFQGRDEGDDETAENLNNLSADKWETMEMDQFTHDFQWDAMFFGRSVGDLSEFDRDVDKTTVPYVIDPMTFIRDPKAISVRGNKGRGKLRFGGYEIAMTRNEIDLIDDFMHADKVKPSESRTEIQRNHDLRQSAQGYDQPLNKTNNLVGENQEFIFYVWYTTFGGKMVRLLVSQDLKTVHRFYVLPYKKYFPLIDCPIYPMPNDWDGVNVPDLVEDKQRHRAAVLNASLRSIKFSQNPAYLFNANKVNRNEIAKTEFGNMIPVDGNPNGEVTLLPRDFVKSDVNWILDVLDGSAQRATATPEIQQGATSKDKKTFGEINLVSSKVDTRYSLSAKLFSSAFKRFWQIWYWNYKEYMADGIDSIMVRISGVNGPRWRKLTKENIVSMVDPDVTIESKVIVEARRFNDLNVFSSFHAQASNDPGYNIRGGLRKMAKLSNIKKDELDILFHKSIDEIEAEEENKMLDENKLYEEGPGRTRQAMLKITQDHDAHIEIHNRASDTPAKAAHIHAHNMAKLILRDNMAMKAQVDMMQGGAITGTPGGSDQDIASQNMQSKSTQDITGGGVNPITKQM